MYLYRVYVAEACCSAGSPWRYTGFLCKLLVFYGQQLNGVRSLEAGLYKPHIPHQDLSCGYGTILLLLVSNTEKKEQLAPSLLVHSDFSLYPNYSFFFLYSFLSFLSFPSCPLFPSLFLFLFIASLSYSLLPSASFSFLPIDQIWFPETLGCADWLMPLCCSNIRAVISLFKYSEELHLARSIKP